MIERDKPLIRGRMLHELLLKLSTMLIFALALIAGGASAKLVLG